MKINHKVLLTLTENTKRIFLGIPTRAKLPDGQKSLTEAERLALAYFVGTLEVLGSLGVDTSWIKLEYGLNDSEGID